MVGRPRRAGVSSFGFGGTNAHVTVERVVEVGPGVLAWVVSARTAAGVGAQAGRLLEFVRAGRELDAGDVGYSLVTTRSLFEHRAVVVGAGRDELLAGLAEVVEGRPGVGVASGVAMPGGKTVFVFPGQGAQWLGMGQELCAGYPVFAAAFDAVVAELDRHLARPLREVVWGADAELLNTMPLPMNGFGWPIGSGWGSRFVLGRCSPMRPVRAPRGCWRGGGPGVCRPVAGFVRCRAAGGGAGDGV